MPTSKQSNLADGHQLRFGRLALGLIGLQFMAAWPVNVLPMMNGALIDHVGFTPSLAGGIASIELLCFSAAMIGLPSLTLRYRCRTIGIVGLLLCLVGNLLTAVTPSALAMAPLRAGVGLGTGLAALAATTAIARSSQVEKLATLLSLTTASFVAFGVLIAGFVIESSGAYGLFLLLALVPLLALISAAFLPDVDVQMERVAMPLRDALRAGPTIASIVSLFGTAVIWSFAERIGVSIGLGVSTVGALIAVMSLAGIFGGGAAIACARFGRERTWAIIGIAVLGLSGIVMPLSTGSFSYGFALAGQAFFFVFVNPFLLALACREDPSGALAARMLGFTGLAAAFAPSLAGALLEAGRIGHLAILPAICTPVAIYALVRQTGNAAGRRAGEAKASAGGLS